MLHNRTAEVLFEGLEHLNEDQSADAATVQAENASSSSRDTVSDRKFSFLSRKKNWLLKRLPFPLICDGGVLTDRFQHGIEQVARSGDPLINGRLSVVVAARCAAVGARGRLVRAPFRADRVQRVEDPGARLLVRSEVTRRFALVVQHIYIRSESDQRLSIISNRQYRALKRNRLTYLGDEDVGRLAGDMKRAVALRID